MDVRKGTLLGIEKKRSIASREMEKHSARRNTPLIKAARISARCHPYEYRESFGEPCAVSCESILVHAILRIEGQEECTLIA